MHSINFLEYIFAGTIAILYGLDIFFLFIFAVHSYAIIYLYRKQKKISTKTHFHSAIDDIAPLPSPKPLVLIQLPIYNEYYVCERLLKYVTQINWPRTRLQIQVLDDSTDESRSLLQYLVKSYKKQGFAINYIHRKKRESYKAGALQAGMLKSKQADFIAIFDADFLPHPDFLQKTMPYFFDKKYGHGLGMVQTRWGHTNSHYSLLTRAQTLGIDGHFVLEQNVRSKNGLWLNFNGTAGVWRRQCIHEAGAWQADTLTEDLDLSYRAQLAGWRMQYVNDIVSPAEIPATIATFKSQQARWCQGSIQTALKLSHRIYQSNAKWYVKLEALLRLFKYSVHPLMLVNILLALPLMYYSHKIFEPLYRLPLQNILGLAAFFCLGSLVSAFFYIYAQKESYADWPRRVTWFPFLMLVGSGISLSNTKAYAKAILSKSKNHPFQRTPKWCLETPSQKTSQKKLHKSSKYTRVQFDRTLIGELILSIWCLYSMHYSIQHNHFLFTALIGIYGIGFLYMAGKGLHELWRYR